MRLVEDLETVLGIKHFNTSTFSSSSSSLVAGWEGVASSSALYCRSGSTSNTPCGPRPGLRKPGTATLIRCKRESFAFITHFNAWKLDEKGLWPRMRWAALKWPSLWTKTFALSILSRLGWLTRLKFRTAACLSAKPLGKQKKKNRKKKWHKWRKMGTEYVKGKKGWLWSNKPRPKNPT